MRKFYPITSETEKVLSSGSSAQLAKVKGCDPSYVRQFKQGQYGDPFAFFLEFYQEAVEAGYDVTPWLRKLQCVRESANAKDDPSDRYCLAKNLEASGKLQTTLAIIEADGVIERCEATEVLKLVEPVKMSVKQIENKMMKAAM